MAQRPTKGKGKPRGRPFEKGNKLSRGRPPGTCNELAAAARRKITPEIADKLIATFTASAGRGSVKAFSQIAKLLPPPPSPPIKIALGPITSAADSARALGEVVAAVSRGELSLEQGDQLSSIVQRAGDAFARSADIAELFAQVEALKRVAQERDAERSPAPGAAKLPWES
jgi:hypothetical protein